MKNHAWLIVLLLNCWLGATSLTAATVTVNGSQQFQTIDGFGVNINAGWWNNGEVKPAIDLLVDQLGATIIRSVIEEMDWEALNDDGDPGTFNWTYYNARYGNAKFTGVWNTLRYLNQKGITNGLVISFMGKGPDWMGANATVDTTKEDEFVETMASLLYYARNTAGVQFTLVSPLNETDTGGVEGPNMGATQHARVLHKLAVKLDAISMSDVRFIGSEAAGDFQGYFNELVKDPVVMAKLVHWGVHQYGSDASGYQGPISGSAYPNKTFWVTEQADSGNLLGMLDDSATANLVWDGFDSIYQHAIRAGRGSTAPNDSPGIDPPLISYNASTHLYTPRTSFYQFAQLFKFVRPGAIRIGGTSSDGNLVVRAYRNSNGQVVLFGRNNNGGTVSVNGTLTNVSATSSFQLYQSNGSLNLQRGTDVTVTTGAFSLSIAGGTFFTLVGVSSVTVAPTITNQPANQSVTVGATVMFSVTATGTPAPTYQWQKNNVNINSATSASYTTPATVIGDIGTSYRCVVTNSAGTVTSNSATLTVIPPTPAAPTVSGAGTATPTLSGTSVAGATIKIYDGATLIGTVTANGSGAWTFSPTLTPGTHQITTTATNSAGTSAASPAVSVVIPSTTTAPTISTQPANQSVAVGATAMFSVTATGTPAPTYQWQRNNANVAGATSASYTTPATFSGDHGATYRCVVTNSAGTVTSTNATLSVTAVPAPIPTPATSSSNSKSCGMGSLAALGTFLGFVGLLVLRCRE